MKKDFIMTGHEFKTIRRWNAITQDQIAKKIGRKSRATIYHLEQREIIPERYIILLSEMIRIDLIDEALAKKAYESAVAGLKANQAISQYT
jgi:DNA-binding XRE family transcriptional regulator